MDLTTSAQMRHNFRYLIAAIDRIHTAICPDQTGTWQERAAQAVAAAERNNTANHLPDLPF